MVKRIILHIGTEKTGTSAVQSYFTENRALYERNGILYPRTPGHEVHRHLAAYAAADQKRDDLRRHLHIVSDGDLQQFRATTQAALAAELDETECETAIFSSEHCHSRLRSVDEIRCLYDLLSPLCDELQVIVYFRRQDQLALSWYSTRVKSGFKNQVFFPEDKLSRLYYFDHWRIYRHWTQVFGEKAVTARLFERELFVNGDLVEDLHEAAGLTVPEGRFLPKRRNESLSGLATEFLRLFNTVLPSHIDGLRNPEREGIVQFLEAHVPGAPFLPRRAEAQAFMALFEEGNAALHDTLGLADRPTLFEMDFSGYPEGEAGTGELKVSRDDVMHIAALLWLHGGDFRTRPAIAEPASKVPLGLVDALQSSATSAAEPPDVNGSTAPPPQPAPPAVHPTVPPTAAGDKGVSS
ncbi:MAG: hypothetical protein AAFV62_00850 [Pseudomonadota bacterium]